MTVIQIQLITYRETTQYDTFYVILWLKTNENLKFIFVVKQRILQNTNTNKQKNIF